MSAESIVKRRKGSKHDKTGCLTCRHRHKKCLENTFPVCGTCARLNLVCVRAPRRQIVKVAESDVEEAESIKSPTVQESESSASSSLPDGRIIRAPQSSQPRENRMFMKYYVDVLARMLTTSHAHNSFLSEFVPMAMESEALLKALVAFSSSHMSFFNDCYQVAALETHSTALRALSSAVSSEVVDIHQSETNLAASLVLATSYVVDGRREGWYDHLIGAKGIILSAKVRATGGEMLRGIDALKESTEGRWLLRNFAYHDIMSSVASGKSLLLEADYLSNVVETVDTYVGVASEVLILISKISTLELPIQRVRGSPLLVDPQLEVKVMEIETSLREWLCPEDTDTALTAMAYAYRSAALLYLYHRLRTLPTSSTRFIGLFGDLTDRVNEEVANAIYHMSTIPWNDSPEGSLLFPMFVVGVTTTDPSRIAQLRTRMNALVETRGFQNVKRATEVLDRVWELSEQESDLYSGGLHWHDIVQIDGGGLLLS